MPPTPHKRKSTKQSTTRPKQNETFCWDGLPVELQDHTISLALALQKNPQDLFLTRRSFHNVLTHSMLHDQIARDRLRAYDMGLYGPDTKVLLPDMPTPYRPLPRVNGYAALRSNSNILHRVKNGTSYAWYMTTRTSFPNRVLLAFHPSGEATPMAVPNSFDSWHEPAEYVYLNSGVVYKRSNTVWFVPNDGSNAYALGGGWSSDGMLTITADSTDTNVYVHDEHNHNDGTIISCIYRLTPTSAVQVFETDNRLLNFVVGPQRRLWTLTRDMKNHSYTVGTGALTQTVPKVSNTYRRVIEMQANGPNDLFIVEQIHTHGRDPIEQLSRLEVVNNRLEWHVWARLKHFERLVVGDGVLFLKSKFLNRRFRWKL